MLDKRVRDLLNHAPLVRFPHEIVSIFSIGTPMPNQLISAAANGVKDLGGHVVKQAVGVVGRWQLQLFEQVKETPDADAIAVITPRIVALGLGLANPGTVVATPLAERKAFDIRRDAKRQALAAWPVIVGAIRNGEYG
jgi:hypothetical protein